MADPQPPIIVLRQSDDAVSAFFSMGDVLEHLGGGDNHDHGLGDNASQADFFDARGRRLAPVLNSDGLLEDFSVESEESHADDVRERVRHRAVHAGEVLEQQLSRFERVDRTPLTLADEDIEFEVFAWRLANALRPEFGPHDPVPKGDVFADDSRGAWHNWFCH